MTSIKNFDVVNKRVLVRCDFNVPLNEDGNIADDFRIKQAIPTIQHLIKKGARVVLISHLDPESSGVVDKKFTLTPIAQKLSDLMNIVVEQETDCIGPEVEASVNSLNPGQVLLLENLRFYKEEVKGDKDFAKKLSYLGDIYVNDAFSVCHRNHASIVVLPAILPHAFGFLLEKELDAVDKIIKKPKKPLVVVMGGKKVETKSAFINRISEIADKVVISGLLKQEILDKNIELDNLEKVMGPENNFKSLDIEDKFIQEASKEIVRAKTIFWNGPFGKFEDENYANGTLAIANAIIMSGAFSVVGGGETVEFLSKYNIIDKFGHVSTGGGAMMSYISGESLPGLKVLEGR